MMDGFRHHNIGEEFPCWWRGLGVTKATPRQLASPQDPISPLPLTEIRYLRYHVCDFTIPR
jgi:hypothetical protein